ncbi:glycosyltransferase family 2 protein [Aliikangiella marina]|uniref:Glycosyltransferase family 2 protein n=1 Tax=Aliikangiella marina TaxID=1712262 RepID=A0A545TIM2_9GAMM|nr:glycosyltransferase [Aliikangiella marina]TQV77031.1 glycosyltransferase family 2 protein [Aliikangiella marina]
MLAKVCVFGFNRPHHAENLLRSLSACKLAEKTDVVFIVDGPRNKKESVLCLSTLDSTQSFERLFKSLTVIKRESNFGLAKSLVSGVSQVLNECEKVIVLEDDLVLTTDFLKYMNQALDYYKNNDEIGSISAFTTPIVGLDAESVYFHPRPTSWGWATWRDRWDKCDWSYSPSSLLEEIVFWFKSRKAGQDVYRMFKNNSKKKINSWAIMWTAYHITHDLKSVCPVTTRVRNNGFDSDATHCFGMNPFPSNFQAQTDLDTRFVREVLFDRKVIKQINYYHSNIFKFKNKLRLILK